MERLRWRRWWADLDRSVERQAAAVENPVELAVAGE
jgi:hypothetical protein